MYARALLGLRQLKQGGDVRRCMGTKLGMGSYDSDNSNDIVAEI